MIEFILGVLFVAVVAYVIFKVFKKDGRRSTVAFDKETNKPVYEASQKVQFGNLVVEKQVPKKKKAQAKREEFYNKELLEITGGEASVKLDNGLIVDIMTDTHAIEVDFGGMKIYEGIGQALVYAYYTGLKPGLIIMIRDDKEDKLYKKLEEALNYFATEYNMMIQVYKVIDRVEGTYEDYDAS